MSLGLVGATLGKYEILSEIGQGGMSVVYRARDSQLEREVAIKVMHAFLAEQPEAKARFHREAVAVARLRHPNIIEIYDYSGEQAAQSYIVTELVEGASLATRLGASMLVPPEAALVVASAVAEALAHAHEQGVIHRDLKPENILIGRDGSLKLTDFGIARMLDNQTLTVTGTLLGSPAYMAPEYIDGAPTDARADIFSFGAMLYQFVTGHLPFEAQSPHALLKRIVAGEYMPPDQRNPRVHAAIARIIKRALAREPAERYPSARELAGAIDAVLQRIGLDPKTELPRVLAGGGPPDDLERALVPRYVGLGKMELARRQVGRALEDFDRVLSVEPEHHEVRRIVRRLARRAWVGRVTRDAVLALVGAAALTVGVGTLLGRQVDSAPPAAVEAEATNGRDVERLVTFVVRGPGDLYVDDQLHAKGATGTFPRRLRPGPHRARLVGGGRDITVPFEVLATRDPPPVRLDVTTPEPRNGAATPKPPVATPSKSKVVSLRIAGGLWVDVRQDDEDVMKNQLSPVRLTLAYGTHRLRFFNPCCDPYDLDVTVSDTEPPALDPIDLKPSPARLYVDGAPPGSRVEVAGKREGLRDGEPVFVPMATRGPVEHLVTVMRGDRLVLRAMARFEPGRERRLSVPLE